MIWQIKILPLKQNESKKTQSLKKLGLIELILKPGLKIFLDKTITLKRNLGAQGKKDQRKGIIWIDTIAYLSTPKYHKQYLLTDKNHNIILFSSHTCSLMTMNQAQHVCR